YIYCINNQLPLTINIYIKTNGKYLEWESEKGKAYCHGGFNYTNGYLVVPTEGMYRVFLQITFEGKDDFHCDDDHLALTIKVFEKSNQYNANMPLLSSVDTVSCNMGKWSKSLYTNALFKLYANSTLCVQSSYPDLIVTNEYLVFFGAEFLHQ
uniref:THD domain-containing protein n=1 Tax=Mastacembelus armatus TaxID=205130 RepID=A0A3Q3MZW5_9TELE